VIVIVIHPPLALSLRRTSRFCCHPDLCGVLPEWSTGRRRLGEEVVRRLITNSIRLLMDHNSIVYVQSTWNSRNWQSTQAPVEITWPLACLPSYVSLSRLIGMPRLLHLHTRVAFHSRMEQTSSSRAAMTSGSIGTSSINISPVGKHSEKRRSEPTAVHIFLWCKIQVFSLKRPDAKRTG